MNKEIIELEDKNAIIKEVGFKYNHLGSKVLYIEYTISQEYAKEYDLLYLNRVMEIIVDRVEGDESLSKTSFAKNF